MACDGRGITYDDHNNAYTNTNNTPHHSITTTTKSIIKTEDEAINEAMTKTNTITKKKTKTKHDYTWDGNGDEG